MELTEALQNRRLERQIAMHEIDTNIKEKNMGRTVGSKNTKLWKSTHRVCADTVYFHRINHGMTQTELAEKIGISMRTIQKMENDLNFRTTKRMAYKIADEIVNNPPPQNSETLNLLSSWNKET